MPFNLTLYCLLFFIFSFTNWEFCYSTNDYYSVWLSLAFMLMANRWFWKLKARLLPLLRIVVVFIFYFFSITYEWGKFSCVCACSKEFFMGILWSARWLVKMRAHKINKYSQETHPKKKKNFFLKKNKINFFIEWNYISTKTLNVKFLVTIGKLHNFRFMAVERGNCAKYISIFLSDFVMLDL